MKLNISGQVVGSSAKHTCARPHARLHSLTCATAHAKQTQSAEPNESQTQLVQTPPKTGDADG